jgi:DNA polymerase V
MAVIDGLNKRYGRGTVKVSTQGAFKTWQMNQNQKSPSYTTDWQQVPVV